MKQTSPALGLGVGWRPELALAIERRRPGVGFVEVLAEDLDPAAPLPPAIEQLRRRGVTVIPHGVSLSLGGAEPLDRAAVARLARLAERLHAPLVSEHLAFVRAAGIETGHLLPLPRSRAAVACVVEKIRAVQAELPVPLAVENIASLIAWLHPEMDEADFLAEVVEQADVPLLLDVANVYANARNHGGDPTDFLDRVPLERIAYVHVAGGLEGGGLYHDTHTAAVPPPVLELLETLCSRAAVPGVMLERDDHFPSEAQFNAELDAIAAAVARGNARREACRVAP